MNGKAAAVASPPSPVAQDPMSRPILTLPSTVADPTAPTTANVSDVTPFYDAAEQVLMTSRCTLPVFVAGTPVTVPLPVSMSNATCMLRFVHTSSTLRDLCSLRLGLCGTFSWPSGCARTLRCALCAPSCTSHRITWRLSRGASSATSAGCSFYPSCLQWESPAGKLDN